MGTLSTVTPTTVASSGNPLAILVSPLTFFERLRSVEAPSFWPPAILISLGSWGFTALSGWLVGFDQIAANEMAVRGVTVTDPSFYGRVSAVLMLSWPFTFVLLTLLASVALYGVFALAMGYKLSLRQMMAVLFFAHLPRIFRYILCLVPLLVVTTTREHFLTSNPLPTNPGFFFWDAEINRGLLVALSSFDLFTFWTLTLIACGVSTISSRPFAKTAGVVMFCWTLLLAVKVLMA